MRFLLLKQVGNSSSSQSLASTSKKAVNVSTGKAWGQQCGPACGCVLRIETKLSYADASSAPSTSPTILEASYHAKRVMATASKNNSSNGGIRLKPLTTQHKSNTQPILSSCKCPTLHQLAQQTVDYLPGKTLARVRNDIEMGVANNRSSVAFRHTVLRENILPVVAEKSQKTIRLDRSLTSSSYQQLDNKMDDAKTATGVHEMNSTNKHGHCYDLVEDSLLSMIHERMPISRTGNEADFYSITLGRYLSVYDFSGAKRKQHLDDNMQQNESSGTIGHEHELSSIHEASDWQRKSSPSSVFLFGDESNATNSTSMSGMFIQHVRDSINTQLLGSETKAQTDSADDRPTTYLQLLDMYGQEVDSDDNKEDDWAKDDWLEYVDQMQYNTINTMSTTA